MDRLYRSRSQLKYYETFNNFGNDGKPLAGYKKISAHFIYDVKHDSRHNVGYVADGHKTDIPLESIYSGVVNLRSLIIVVFLAELNGLEL